MGYIIKNNGFSYTDKFNKQIESLIDRYLDIVDKIDEVLESFDQLKLWKELQQVDDTIEEWMTVHVEELINNKNSSLDDSATFRQKLSKVEEQLNEKDKTYELLQKKILEVQQARQSNQVGELDEIVLVNENIKQKI